MNLLDIEAFIFSKTPVAYIEDGALLPQSLDEWLKVNFLIKNEYIGDGVLNDSRYDIYVLTNEDSALFDIVRAECLSAGSILLVLRNNCDEHGDCLFRMEKLKCGRDTSITVYIPEILVVNKVASYAYKDASHFEWPFPAIVPRGENKALIECADITDSNVSDGGKVSRARAVNQFYGALESQYLQVPFDFSFCAIGMPLSVNVELKERLPDIFLTGILVDTSGEPKESKCQSWNAKWLPEYMADGSTTREITNQNAKSIKDFLVKKQPAFGKIKDDYVVASIAFGKYIPVFGGCCAVSGFFLCPPDRVPVNAWIHLIKHCYSCLNLFVLDDAGHRFRMSATRSAIGSIMSRNGSHNIGSHVLAALSHNVGTMPDDRVLYQYIQHRMDYIATATTELPVWNQPLSFVSNLVKTFLMQRHLLDYITGSEGLKAYQFQNRTVDTTSIGCQPNTIRLHVRRVGDDDNRWIEENNYSVEFSKATNFISYPGDKSSPNALMKDLEVAIPGGIVGQHAFFTILENILRNAAKHEWAKLGKEEKANDKQKYLDVHVDFKDNPEDGIVEVVAWTDNEYSRIHYKYNDFSEKVKSLTPTEIQEFLSKEKSENELDLSSLDADHKKLQVRMARSFIGENGDLHKENWGLAEMRISAGYLNTVDISEIGGLDETKSSELSLIKPVMVLNGDHYCLGYHFHIPKPRELLVVVPRELSIDKLVIDSANKRLMRYGVAVITEGDVQKESSSKERSSKLSYAYVLLKEFRKNDEVGKQSEDMCKWKLPFRVITTTEAPLSPIGNRKIDRRANFVGENRTFFDEDKFLAWIANVSGSDKSAKFEAEQLLYDIYLSWVRHLKKERFGKSGECENIPIAIDLGDRSSNSDGNARSNDSNAKKSLISDIDVLKVVFETCFNTAVKSFLGSPVGMNCDAAVRSVLNNLMNLTPRKVELKPTKTMINNKTREEWIENRPLKGVVMAQLRDWCTKLQQSDDVKVISNALIALENAIQSVYMPLGLNEFICFIEDVILEQAKVFLSKYEETYATLPKDVISNKGYARKGNTGFKNGPLVKLEILDDQEIYETILEADKYSILSGTISKEQSSSPGRLYSKMLAYWRHENPCVTRELPAKQVGQRKSQNKKAKKPVDVTYLEPLSGAQSYVNSFGILTSANSSDLQKVRFVSKLLETGLVRVLIIDERVRKFENEHSDVRATFDKIGVTSLDDTSAATEKIFNKELNGETGIKDVVVDDNGRKVGDYDILVIHQGIIDKKLSQHSNPERINKFIEHIKSEIRYVVVTTGRGNPANIPDTVRVVPFSVLESTLFKKYPEKLVLVDAIMNVLPSGRKE